MGFPGLALDLLGLDVLDDGLMAVGWPWGTGQRLDHGMSLVSRKHLAMMEPAMAIAAAPCTDRLLIISNLKCTWKCGASSEMCRGCASVSNYFSILWRKFP